MVRIRYRNALRLAAAAVAVFGVTAFIGTATSQTSISSSFDHYTTAFRLDGAHQFAECGSCHVDGMFVGTPQQCVQCHSEASRVRATSKPARHNLTTEQCEACHRTSAWSPVVRVDHFEVFGSCIRCHDGRRAPGKPVNHIPAGNQCDDCHSVRMWAR
jgi:hypothetical protein